MQHDLEEITQSIEGAASLFDRGFVEASSARAQMAIANALVALCDRLDKLTTEYSVGPESPTRKAIRVYHAPNEY